MACFLTKSFERDMSTFAKLSPQRQREIARTVQIYLDDMLEKIDPQRQSALEQKESWFWRQRGEQERKKIDDLLNPLFTKAYPLLSQGLGLTDPIKPVSFANSGVFPDGILDFFSVTKWVR